MILANYLGHKVKVLDTRRDGKRIRAYIEAFVGEPFSLPTHGGPMQSSTTWIPAALLTGIEYLELPA